MQKSTLAQATPAPAAPATPTPSFTTVGADGKTPTLSIPSTEEQVQGLAALKAQLSANLADVSDRRHDLSEELQGTSDDIARKGLTDRISLLDKQILRLETDLATTNNELAATPPELLAGTSISTQSSSDNFAQGATVGGVSTFVLCAVFFAMARRRWRGRRRPTSPLLENDSVQRLQRLENGMEAIAIEIERVSEGQRFVTRLLSESQPPLAASQQRGTVMSENPPKR
ncbi:MAG: hypothetical protein ACRENK_04530 [Gemmatimonadaceae bacterium]